MTSTLAMHENMNTEDQHQYHLDQKIVQSKTFKIFIFTSGLCENRIEIALLVSDYSFDIKQSE